MALTNPERRSIVDVAGVLDTSLKLVTIKSLKMNNFKIMSKTNKKLVKQFFGESFSGGGDFSWGPLQKTYDNIK